MVYKCNLIEKLLEYRRILITFSLVLLLSFTYIFHGLGEKVESEYVFSRIELDNLIKKDDKISEKTAQEKWLLERSSPKNLPSLQSKDEIQGLALRHKTRWVINYFELKKTKFLLSNFSPKISFALYCFLFSFLISASYLFCLLSFEHITKKKDIKYSFLFSSAFIFYLYPLFFDIHEYFSFYELFAVSACIFFALKKKIWFFLLFAILGILNRETGLLLATFYTFINFKKKLYLLPIFVLPFIFIFINIDFFKQLSSYSIGLWLAPFDSSVSVGSINQSIFNYFGLQYFYSLLRIFLYLLPMIVLLFYTKFTKNLKIFLLILSLYSCSLFLGTLVTNLFPFIIFAIKYILIH